MTQGTLSLPSGELAYATSGEGPLVVMTHGLGPVAWGDVAPLSSTCTVVVLDWESSKIDREASWSLSWFAPLVRALGHERAVLVSWSMSGPGAIYFAAEEPAELSKLILIDVAGIGDGMPDLGWRDIPHFVLMKILGRPTRGFVRMLWRGWVHRKDVVDTKPLEEATLRFFRANPDAFGLPGSEEDGDDEDEDEEELIDELPSITVPTLVLAGRHSSVLGPELGRLATERLRDGRLVVFEESGHSLQLEESARFHEVVAEFVAEPRAGE